MNGERDMDLVRDILLEIEAWPPMQNGSYRPDGSEFKTAASPDQALYHLRIMATQGYLELRNGDPKQIMGLSWEGHDLLDSIRDAEIWRQTKAGAKQIKGFTVEVIKDVAKAYLRKKVKDLTDGEFQLSAD